VRSTRRSVNFVSLKGLSEHESECKVPCSSLFFLLLMCILSFILWYLNRPCYVRDNKFNNLTTWFFSRGSSAGATLKLSNPTENKIIGHPWYTGRYQFGKLRSLSWDIGSVQGNLFIDFIVEFDFSIRLHGGHWNKSREWWGCRQWGLAVEPLQENIGLSPSHIVSIQILTPHSWLSSVLIQRMASETEVESWQN
jgi:hypothetical protein